jgi:hypothetical protein
VDEETVAAATETESSPSADTLTEAPKPTTAEIVAAARADRAKPTEKPSTETSGDKKPDEAAKGGDEKPEFYTDAEYATLDFRTADLNRVKPELRTTFKAMQQSERTKHEKLNRELKAAEEQKTAKPKETAKPEEEETLFNDDEIDAMLRSKKGEARLDKWAADRGIDFDQLKVESGQRLIRSAVGDATAKHAELKDEKFFDETADAIASDEDWSQAFADNKGNRKMLGLIFEAAAASVKLARASARTAEVTKDREAVDKEKAKIKTQKETANARAQVTSIPIKKPGSGSTRTTLDIVKEVRAARKSI